MNKVIIKGRLTANPELTYTQTNNNPVVKFSVAVNRVKEGVDFFNCIAWNKTAEFISKYFVKGQEILIEGRLENSEYEGRVYTRIIVEQDEFCGSKTSENKTVGDLMNVVEDNTSEDDLPF